MMNRSVLDCGLVVLSEYIPAFPSFSMSYTVRGGSRMESVQLNGIYHLIEHMLFKGTEKYNLKEIADISDRLGGKLNAFTSKEITQFYLKAIDEHLPESFDLLTQMVRNSTFPDEEFNKEKSVAVQEIYEADDNPETNAFETFYRNVYQNNGLGFPVGGRVGPVNALERDQVYDFYVNNYAPNNLVLSAVGKIEHQRLVDLANDAFKDAPASKPRSFLVDSPNFSTFTKNKKNDSLSQVYMIMGFDAVSMNSPDRYPYMIINDVLGSGMSSRLFQRIREDLGLAYTVSSFTDAYNDCGMHLIYAVIKPENASECIDAVKEELEKLRNKGITAEELDRARYSIKSSIILGLESNVNMMRFHINNELFQDDVLNPEQIIQMVNTTSVDDINSILPKYLDSEQMSLLLYGDVLNA